MDLTYLAYVTLFGMCAAAVRPCRCMPTTGADYTASVATVPSSPVQRSSVTVGQAVDDNGGNDGDGKRSRSLQFPLPSAPHYHRYDDVQYNDDVTANDLSAAFYAHQQQIDDDDDDSEDAEQADVRLSSRARPGKPDSPVYFIRLPPQPYMYVPGYGYVSQPTRLEPPPFTQRPQSPFMNLPLGYVSNGKPVGVYTLPQQQHHHHHQQQQQQQQQYHQQYQYQNQQQQRPQSSTAGRPKPNRRPQLPPVQMVQPPQEVVGMPPDSPVYDLDKGPYVFNGRPSDAYLLHTAYDNLYSEVLQNIYP